MKKIIALLLAVVMVFALVACASTAKTEEKTDEPAPAETTNEETTAPAEETDAPAEDETAEPAGDAVGTDIKIGVVLIGDENEGYTYSHIKGIQEAAKALGISESNIVWKYSIGEDETCYDACVDCVDQGCQIVITNSYGHQSFCLQAAEEYPDVQFVAMTGDTAKASGLDNFHNAFTGIYEARYVGGVVAGMKLQELIDEGKVEDKNKTADGKIKIGYVGAYPYAEVVSGYTAFFLGLQSIVPDVAMQVQYTNSWFNITAENEAAKALKTNPSEMLEKITHLQAENKSLKGEVESLKSKMAQSAAGDILDQVKEVKGVKLLAAQLDGVDMNGRRDLGDQLKEKIGEGVVVIASSANGKVSLMATATDEAMKKGAHAGNLIKAIASCVGGGGGGRPNMAQAGGKNPAGIPDALAKVKEVLAEQIK